MDVLVIRFEDTDTVIFESSYGFLGRLLEFVADPDIQMRYRGGDDEPVEFRISSDSEEIVITDEFRDLVNFTIKSFGAVSVTEEMHYDVTRYEVRDQNGDMLEGFNSYGLAQAHFAQWIKWGDRTLNGSGIFNNVNGGWEVRVAHEEPEEDNELCETCKVQGHDTCSLTPGCPCCEDTMENME